MILTTDKVKIIRARTPVITPDELLAECATGKPATIAQAVEIAEITLRAHLESLLENFPYRNEMRSPRAVWARMTVAALERIISVREQRMSIKTQVRQLLEEATAE